MIIFQTRYRSMSQTAVNKSNLSIVWTVLETISIHFKTA